MDEEGKKRITLRGVSALLVFLGIIALIGFGIIKLSNYVLNVDRTENSEIIYGPSEKYKDEDIKAAVDEVRAIHRGMMDYRLNRLWYDEKEAEACLQYYRDHDAFDETLLDEYDLIIVFADVETAMRANHEDCTFTSSLFKNPNPKGPCSVSKIIFFVVREKSSSSWYIYDWFVQVGIPR